MIILGSRAYAYNLKDVQRVSRFTDYDVIMTNDQFKEWYKVNKEYITQAIPNGDLTKYNIKIEKGDIRIQYEIELDVYGSSKLLLENEDEVTKGEYKGFFGEVYKVLKLDYLGITKRSHITYPIHFEKNIKDYQAICKASGRKYGKGDREGLEEEYYQLRAKEVQERQPQKTPNLNVTVDDFFSSRLPVKAYFVHDDLHRLMAHRQKPIFEMMQKDATKAWCEKDMFFDLPYEYQLEAVVEEAYVIALERYIIPQFKTETSKDYYLAFLTAVKRICTTLTSGWFRRFAFENYNDVIAKYDEKYVTKFLNAYSNGKITPKEEYKDEDIPFITHAENLGIL